MNVPQDFPGGLPPEVPETAAEIDYGGPSRAELAAFVGPRSEYYLSRWDPDNHLRWNTAAFLLGGIWLCYRRMYRPAAIFFGLVLATSLAAEFYYVDGLGMEAPPALAGHVSTLTFALICSLVANGLYFRHARNVINGIKARNADRHAAMEQITRCGGTSLPAALAGPAIFMAAALAALMLKEALGL